MRAAIIEKGIVVNVAVADEDFAKSQGWVPSTDAQIGWTYDGKKFAPPVVPVEPVTAAAVDYERDRRIASGVTFGGKLYQSRATDRENIAGAAQLAFMALVGGAKPGELKWADGENDFAWIAADNELVPMDAQTTVDFGKSAAAQKQALIFAARDLKNMGEIPQDYKDDKWWTA